jgi:hypothetical protein
MARPIAATTMATIIRRPRVSLVSWVRSVSRSAPSVLAPAIKCASACLLKPDETLRTVVAVPFI